MKTNPFIVTDRYIPPTAECVLFDPESAFLGSGQLQSLDEEDPYDDGYDPFNF